MQPIDGAKQYLAGLSAISKSLTAGSKNVDGVTAVCNSENSAGRQIVQKIRAPAWDPGPQ
jgi:hypothetical protein